MLYDSIHVNTLEMTKYIEGKQISSCQALRRGEGQEGSMAIKRQCEGFLG